MKLYILAMLSTLVLFLQILLSGIVTIGGCTLLGYYFDMGHKDEGNVRHDLPSSIGILVGIFVWIWTILKLIN
jgi:hypothetical protein